MNHGQIFALQVVAILTLGAALSYGLALADHPTAFWFWHNVLGVL